ncbi:LCP family protein [Candidatus Dojkabacteria bacterium]|nr:LCP family protein [Candidatus Dojkabacteria bacterium]
MTKTLVILGIDEDRNINTEFVDFLSLITIDDRTKEIKILNINTKYTWYIQKSNQYIPFKSLLVFYKTFYPQENYIESFISAVEKLSSIRVDGYVVVTKNGLEELSPVISPVKVTAPSNLEDMDIPGYTIKKGENNLKETDILKFVSADDNGDNDKLQRQLSTIQSLITNFEIHKLFINQQSIIEIVEKEMKTNLTGEDLLNLFIKLKLGQYKFKVGYTDSTTAIQIENELDERWYTVYNTLDKDIQKVYINEDVKMEQAKIDIFNATNLPGLARSRARGLSNKGLRVVLVGNTDKKFEKTTIYLNTEKDYSNTLNEIYNTLDSNAIEIKHEKYDGRSVGDIVVVLGNNEIV